MVNFIKESVFVDLLWGPPPPPPPTSGYRVSKESAHLISQNVFRGSLLAV